MMMGWGGGRKKGTFSINGVDGDAGSETLALETRDGQPSEQKCAFSWKATIVAVPEGTQRDGPVVRKNVEKMPKEELDRVIAALKMMMEPAGGKKGSSEYSRIAGYAE